MLLELEAIFVQLFPESGDCGAPFTLREISANLSREYERFISYDCVRRAFCGLLENVNTTHLVRPLDGDEREFLFSAAAARRIARRAIRGQLPPRHQRFHKNRPNR